MWVQIPPKPPNRGKKYVNKEKEMTVFFTSDQHYYHKNICRFANRPYESVEEMNENMIRNHNRVVQPTDTVWCLGDFAFADSSKIKTILHRLNGNIHLILGNHDKQISNTRKSFIGENLFTSIQDYKELNIYKQPIILFHYGMRVWNKSHHGSWLLYGHSHGTLPPLGKSVDVGVDCKEISDEYRPYSFEEIRAYMNSRNICKEDRH